MVPARVLPLRLTAAAVVLFVAGYLPWGAVRASSLFGTAFEGLPTSGLDGDLVVNLTGWNGSSTFLMVSTPNWTSFAAALLLALWSWFDEGLAGKRWPQWLAVLFIVHALYLAYAMITQGGARLGLGVLVALAVWIGVLVTLRRSAKEEYASGAAFPDSSNSA